MAKPDVCKLCPAYNEPGPVWADPCKTGKPRAIIVGEAPGENEVGSGKPFMGSAGGLLWSSAAHIGLNRVDCHVTNVAKCNTKNNGAFIYCWRVFGKPEIESLPTDIPIIALGAHAKDTLIPSWAAWGVLVTRGCTSGRVTSALHPAFIRRTARAASESSAEKQDLAPTLPYDISAALDTQPLPSMVVQSVNRVVKERYISCDIETDRNLNPRNGKIDQFGFGLPNGQTLRESYNENNRWVYQANFDANVTVFHNAAFDVHWMEYNKYHRFEPEMFEDTMLAAHLLHGDLPLGLEYINSLYVHVAPWWKQTKRFADGTYHATDLYVTAMAWSRMELELKASGLYGLYTKELKPVTRRCIDMKEAGIKVDNERMMKMRIAFSMQVEKIENALNKLSPGTNWGSPKQVAEVIYGAWGLPPQKINGYEEGSMTTNAEALEALVEETGHVGVKLLLAHRQYGKMISTYTDHELDSNNRFHFDVSYTTATGRARGFILTLPRGIMRSVFIADEPGWEIANLDWDRVELWISAVCSGDTVFQQILRDFNFHSFVGERCFGKPVVKGTPEYEATKHITHGANFGRSAISISKGHDIPLNTVNIVLNWMENTFHVWAAWRKAQLDEARRTGGLTNHFGYRRYMWSGNIKGMAYSLEPQSCVAHMNKRAVIQMFDELPKPARVVFPFHDAVAITYPKEMRDQVTKVAKGIMEQPWPELGGWSATCKTGYGYDMHEASK